MAEELGMIHYRVLQDVLLNAVSSSYTTKANNILNKHNPTTLQHGQLTTLYKSEGLGSILSCTVEQELQKHT